MRTNEDLRAMHRQASGIDLPVGDSVALRRLVGEVERHTHGQGPDATLYNRTYHRHNR